MLDNAPVTSALQLLAYVFDGLSNFPPATAESFLDVSGRFIGDSLVVKILVVSQIPCGLLHLTLELIGLAIDLVSVHREPPAPTRYKKRCVSNKDWGLGPAIN
jgi:hypothetical protein